jgi:hypothetical protein
MIGIVRLFMISGQVHVMFDNVLSSIGHLQSGGACKDGVCSSPKRRHSARRSACPAVGHWTKPLAR